MKRTFFLFGCVVMLLAVCVTDVYLQNKNTEKNMLNSTEETIRVLIRSDYFESEYHDSIKIQTKEGFEIDHDREEIFFDGGECVEITGEEDFFEEEVLYLKSMDGIFVFPELERGQEHPQYQGNMEIWKTQSGLLLVNELPLEDYLCAVVPSEMPAYYPKEALKAQAVCARTYAMKQKEEKRAAMFHADVDDSVSYQVYNNQPADVRTNQAVKETNGIVLKKEEQLIDAWYYSTSCGMDFSMDLSQEAVFAAFLSENNLKSYEAGEPWYRWQTEILLADLGNVQEISVKKRNRSGRVEELLVVSEHEGTLNEEVIVGEYSIRSYLNRGALNVTLQDGNVSENMSLLPSAFFAMSPIYETDKLIGYHLLGGGYGHGNGMSQNGAKAMAEDGMGYVEILGKYYGEGTYLAETADT